MSGMTCLAIDVSRGTTHDGPGMRDTVFVKGCPLRCRWCQNPESIRFSQEVWWEARNCIACRDCLSACEKGALSFDEDGARVDRALCDGCGACADACPGRAMERVGKEWTLDSLVREVLRDRKYYDSFGGGVTVSGGEPLLRAPFVAAFFERLHAEGIHTALDTCGLAPCEALEAVLPHADLVLFDVKLASSDRHRAFTGQPNERILENLSIVARRAREGALKLWIRTPLIPGATATEENLASISRLLAGCADAVERWELCAFNAACRSKYAHLRQPWLYEGAGLLSQDAIDRLTDAAVSGGFPRERLLVSGMVSQK